METVKPDKVEKTLRAASKILAAEGKDLRASLYQDIILNALKCQLDDLDILDLKIINRALAEFRHAALLNKRSEEGEVSLP